MSMRSVTHRRFRGLVLVAGVLFASGACSGGKSVQPNLLIIVSDALRADVLGCYGGAAHTPNIDRLAARGVLFERCYSTAPWTWPAAVSMFTANYPAAYHPTVERLFPENRAEAVPVTLTYVPDEEQLIGEACEAAGYEVRMALQNPLPRRSNSLQGFLELDPAAVTAEKRAAVARAAGPDLRQSGPFLALLDYLLEVPTGQPFCLLGWVLDPHGEYDPPRRFKPRAAPGDEPLPRKHRYYAGLGSRQLKDLSAELSMAERAYIRALYEAEVEYVDQRVGRLLAVLEHRGLLENTFVVFTSDHGEAFWEHGFPSHGNTYFEEMVRVPLIFSGPGIACGRRVETPVSHVGLAPTLAELLGIGLPGPLQGISHAGLFSGTGAGPGPVYFTGAHQQFQVDAILDGRYKMIAECDGAKELYDLFADPGETRNLAGEFPELVQRLEGRLLEIREENRRHRRQRPQTDGNDGPQESGELLRQMQALGYVE